MADAQEHTIEQQVLDSANAIRLKISHVYYVIVSIFVLPALVASLSRLSEIDFLPIMGLQLVLSIIIWIIVLLRKKIPYMHSGISSSLIVHHTVSIAQFGLLSGGLGFLIIMGPLPLSLRATETTGLIWCSCLLVPLPSLKDQQHDWTDSTTPLPGLCQYWDGLFPQHCRFGRF